MANDWRAHVKKTMSEMKSTGKKVMLKDVLKMAAKTYKKESKSAAASSSSSSGSEHKKKTSKRKSRKAKSMKKRKH